jgi:hypothetical protein
MSFGLRDLNKLEMQEYVMTFFPAIKSLIHTDVCSYWVCEKSDGVRVLLFISTDITTKVQTVYLV